jgi:hypothetical protein
MRNAGCVTAPLSFPEIDTHSKGEKSFVGRRREGWATIIFDSKFKKAGNALDSVDIFLRLVLLSSLFKIRNNEKFIGKSGR